MASIQNTFIDRKTTKIIKGIAIIMMIIHHVLTFPEWWPNSFEKTNSLIWFAEHFNKPTKLCVTIFAFITGYFYYLSNNRGSYKYSFKKICKFLINYWFVLSIGLLLSLFSLNRINDFVLIIEEMFGLISNVLSFSWYVPFYCISMILLPIFEKTLSYSKSSCILFGIIFPITIGKMIMFFIPDDNLLFSLVSNVRNYFPCMVIGFYASRFDIFNRIDNTLNDVLSNLNIKNMFYFILLIVSFFGRYFIKDISLFNFEFMNNIVYFNLNMDYFYCLFFIYSLVKIINLLDISSANFVLSEIGNESSSMWFIHGLFFSKTIPIFNNLLYKLHSPILIGLFAIVFSYALSKLIKWPLTRLYKRIDLVL